jgi:hypothetical protein
MKMTEQNADVDDAEIIEETGDGDGMPNGNQLVRRTFEGVTMAHETPASQALAAQASAEIQARWVMAMKMPRQMTQVRSELIKECQRPALAKRAVYKLPRGGKTITGLTIRFAEVAMRCMGNMNAESKTLYETDEDRLIRVTVTDYEKNASWTRDVTVKKTVERKQLARGQRPIRSRVNSSGDMVHLVEATEDEVTQKEAVAISKVSRTGILRMIPGWLQDEARAVAERVAADAAAKDPDSERNEMLDHFATQRISPEMLSSYLGHPVEQSTPAETAELRFLYRALREGETDWGTVMEDVKKAREANKAKAKAHADAAEKAKSAPAAAAEQKPAEQKPADPKAAAPAAATAPAASSAKSETKGATGGRGAQAAKDKLAGKAPAANEQKPAEPKPADPKAADTKPEAKAEPPKDHPAPTPAPAPAARIQPANHSQFATPESELPPDIGMPSEGNEFRNCGGCTAIIEVVPSEPAGAECYSCRQA